LCYASDFSGLDACLADLVEERSLSAVNVSQHAYDRLTDRHPAISPLVLSNKAIQ
jgi:hypothetical protein